MRRTPRHVAAATGLALAVLATAACSDDSSETSGDLTTVNLGVSPFLDTMLPIIGEEKGWFEEEGLNVNLQSLAWNAVMPGIASGDVDVAINNTTGVVSVAQATEDIVYAYGYNPFVQGSALVGRPDAGLEPLADDLTGADREAAREETIRQLEGKTIVTTMATDMGKAIWLALDSVGLTLDDVEIVDMDPDQGLAAFLTGTGDAYLGGIPQRARAVQEGYPVLLSGPDLAAPPINGLVTTRGYLEENEDTVLALAHVMHRIIRYCDAETEACGQTIVDRINEDTGGQLTVADFQDVWQNIELFSPDAATVQADILAEDGVAYWQRTWDGDNDYLVSTGEIGAPVAAEDHFYVTETVEKYIEKYGAEETEY